MKVEIRDVCKRFKENTVLNHVNLEMQGGKFTAS